VKLSHTTRYRVQSAKTRAIEEATGFWKRDHDRAMLARDVEDAIHFCVEGPDVFLNLWQDTFERLAAGEIEDVREAGESFRDLLDGSLRIFAEVRDAALLCESLGYRIDGRAELEEATRQVRQIRDQAFAEGWGQNYGIDLARAAGAIRELDEGKGRPLEEVLAQLRG